MKIRPFDQKDMNSILVLQERNPQAARWSESDYRRLAGDPGGMILVAEPETPATILGFAACFLALDEAELRTIAVDPAYHRQGIGRALLDEALQRLAERGARRVFLEVRPSNKPAQNLYDSLGFGLSFVRRDYYQNPPEDAWVMSHDLPARGACGSDNSH